MPVIPSFKSFAETPSAGSSLVGGYNVSADAANAAQALQVRQQAIAADAAQASARIQLGYQQLAQEAVQSKMELQAKQQFQQQQAMKQAQEAEIEQAYRQTQIGFKERELKNEEAITAMRLKDAARGFDQQMSYQRRRAELMAGGIGEREASEQSMREYGFGEGGFGTSLQRESTAERSFEYRQLQDAEKRIFDKYRSRNIENFSPEDRRALSELDKLRRERFSIQPPSQAGWQVDPGTIPNGAPTTAPPPPKNWSMYMGQKPPNEFKILGIRQK